MKRPINPQSYARAGGVLYLMIIALGAGEELLIRGRITVTGDAVATFANLRNMEMLWRAGIAIEMVLVIITIALSVIVYVLTRPVHEDLALMALLFGSIATAVEAAYSIQLVEALFPIGKSAYLTAFTTAQLQTMTMLAMKAHAIGFGIGLLLFGPFFLITGYLIFTSGYLPKTVGVLYQLAGVAYMFNGFVLLLAPRFAGGAFMIMGAPVFIGETTFAVWLLIKGVRIERWTQAVATVAVVMLCLSAVAQPNDAARLDQCGRQAMLRGETKTAVDCFEKAAALNPKDAGAHYRLATASLAAGGEAGMFGAIPFAKKAKAELERAIALDPNLLSARFELLRFHTVAPGFLGGSEASAIEQANEIRKRDAIEGHRAFATIAIAHKKPELARNEYVAMLKESPASARAHYLFGVHLMLADKNYKAAADEFESAVRLDPSYMPAWFQIGHVAALAGNQASRGEEALKRYFAYEPKDDEPSIARAWYWLGTIQEKSGKRADAKSSYAASLKINAHQDDVQTALKRL